MALGIACRPEVIMSTANGSEVQTDPITTATMVKAHTGASTPNCAKTLRTKPSPE